MPHPKEKRTIQRSGDGCHRWEFVMRSVFGDESYDEKRERVFTVVGIFGTEEEWNSLADDWRKTTGGRIFHAAECECDLGDFASTSHKENLDLYKKLAILLASTKLFGYAVSVDLSAHRELFPNNPDPNDVYYFGFYGVLEKFSEINSYELPRDTLRFTFDQNLECRYNAGALYECVRALPEWNGHDLLADTVSYTTRQNPRIQAADLFAREAMKRLDNRIGPIKTVKRKATIALEQTKRFYFLECEREYFQDVIRRGNALRDLPGADNAQRRQWLEKKGLIDNTSNRIMYHKYILSKLQKPAQTE